MKAMIDMAGPGKHAVRRSVSGAVCQFHSAAPWVRAVDVVSTARRLQAAHRAVVQKGICGRVFDPTAPVLRST